MKKALLWAFGALLSINAWSYNDVAATIKWGQGNEASATVTSDALDGVKETKRKVGSALTEGTRNNLAANNGVTMVTYNPSVNKAGIDGSVMVEYSVKMKKGVTFTLTGIEYDAIKQGTDGASYHWTYAVDNVEADPVEVPQDQLVRDNNTTGTPALHHSHAVTAQPGQTVAVRFYVSGFATGKLLCLSDIQMIGTVNGEAEVRAFTDFKLDFRSNPYTVVLPESHELPSNVSVTNLNYKDSQHGLQGGTVTVNVDGPVKFTIGACQYGNRIIVKKNHADYTTIDNKVACDNSGIDGGYNHYVTWTYNVEEAATLSFMVNGFMPYFFAEACDFIPSVEVRYFDADGKTLLGCDTVAGGSALSYKYSASDVTVAEGKAFRGWFDGTTPTSLKVAEGKELTEDLKLYARTTDIEQVQVGAIFNYDFKAKSFYPEDHEAISFSGGSYKDATHGWTFKNNESISVKVAGNALMVVGVCTYSNTGSTEVKDAEGKTIGALEVEKNVTGDGALQTIQYEGPATTLTFHFTSTNYIHNLKVYNIAELPEKNAYGYYKIAPNDGAGLILALETAAEGDKIFLPNGIYDLREAVLTPVSKSNISIIGQSMEGTIIKNAPDFHNEGIGTTATIFIPKGVSNTYFQDLTLQNAMDYYGAIAAGMAGGRAVCLQDEGTQTVLKNVRMLSYQDTYYSKTAGAKHYFEDCEIHGTVDYICGSASVYFKNNVLFCEKRNLNGGGSDCITAHTGKDASGDKGYVFEGCTIMSECPTVSLGRAWGDQARTYFLNTLVDYSKGEFSFTGNGIQRWSQTGINSNPTEFGEYNSHLADGTVLTPASNVVTFNKGSEIQMETVLSAEKAASLTMEYTLGDWAAKAKEDALQNVLTYKDGQWNPTQSTVFMIEKDGEVQIVSELPALPLAEGVVVRGANSRGGFGIPAHEGEPGEGIEQTVVGEKKTTKIIRDGQVVIIRGEKEYSIFGQEVK